MVRRNRRKKTNRFVITYPHIGCRNKIEIHIAIWFSFSFSDTCDALLSTRLSFRSIIRCVCVCVLVHLKYFRLSFRPKAKFFLLSRWKTFSIKHRQRLYPTIPHINRIHTHTHSWSLPPNLFIPLSRLPFTLTRYYTLNNVQHYQMIYEQQQKFFLFPLHIHPRFHAKQECHVEYNRCITEDKTNCFTIERRSTDGI